MSIRTTLLISLLFILMLLHLSFGNQDIEWSTIWDSTFTYDSSNMQHYITREIRFPRMITACIAGAGLSLSGLLMQNIFSNPLADPNILGVNTGASLVVALGILSGATFFQTELGIIGMALTGALVFALIIIFTARYIRTNLSLLLIGIIIGSVTSSAITLLQSYADAQRLRQFTLWTMGSLQNVQLQQLPYLLGGFILLVSFSFLLIRDLNAFALGEQQATYLGINTKRTRNIAIGIAALLAGLITAYCGPIAFIGMAIPNLTRLLLKTQNHQVLIIYTLVLGALFLLVSDIIILYFASTFAIPLNALTAILCAPFIIYVILKKLA